MTMVFLREDSPADALHGAASALCAPAQQPDRADYWTLRGLSPGPNAYPTNWPAAWL